MCHNKSIIHDTGCSLNQRPTPTPSQTKKWRFPTRQRKQGNQRERILN
ncbi:unnamed protein product, partial [Larinioides sclopetarius]